MDGTTLEFAQSIWAAKRLPLANVRPFMLIILNPCSNLICHIFSKLDADSKTNRREKEVDCIYRRLLDIGQRRTKT